MPLFLLLQVDSDAKSLISFERISDEYSFFSDVFIIFNYVYVYMYVCVSGVCMYTFVLLHVEARDTGFPLDIDV